MAEQQPPKTIDISTYEFGAELVIPMLPRYKEKTGGRTVLQIVHKGGIEPLVDCLHTEEGDTIGPAMVFLGSVASRAALVQDPEGSILRGKIAGNHHMVLGDNTKARTPHLISGVVDPDLAITFKIKRLRG